MKILIIDDDPQFTEILGFHLKKQNIPFDIANTKTQVHNYTLRQKYDLILQDVFFPNKEDGLQLLEEVKTNPATKDIPVFLITSMPLELFQQEPNLDHYLNFSEQLISKGEDSQHIVEKVLEVLGNK